MILRFSVAWSGRGLASRHEIRVAGSSQLQTSHPHETRKTVCSPLSTRMLPVGEDAEIRFRLPEVSDHRQSWCLKALSVSTHQTPSRS